jgi:hypothetical protein
MKLTEMIEKAGVSEKSRKKRAEPLLQQTLDLWNSTAELVVVKTEDESRLKLVIFESSNRKDDPVARERAAPDWEDERPKSRTKHSDREAVPGTYAPKRKKVPPAVSENVRVSVERSTERNNTGDSEKVVAWKKQQWKSTMRDEPTI